MIVRNINDAKTVEFKKGGFLSHRYLLESDNMGFSITRTIIPAGSVEIWHYKNHFEACLCVSGEGKVRKVGTEKWHDIRPGVMYALNENDEHVFQSITEVELVCVFNPPLKGAEVHRKDGSYNV